MEKKKKGLAEFLETWGMLILVLLIFSILGSTVVILLSLFLFLIPSSKLRINLFVGLLFVNLICSFILMFNPFDFEIVNSLEFWATSISPDGLKNAEMFPDYEYNQLTDYSEWARESVLGLSYLLNAYLCELGFLSLDNWGVFIVTDLIGGFLYLYMPSLLYGNE
tara:strand:- start:341 stop:835 length:495 start_codon:yes stop_codon:yes gene_type:complete